MINVFLFTKCKARRRQHQNLVDVLASYKSTTGREDLVVLNCRLIRWSQAKANHPFMLMVFYAVFYVSIGPVYYDILIYSTHLRFLSEFLLVVLSWNSIFKLQIKFYFNILRLVKGIKCFQQILNIIIFLKFQCISFHFKSNLKLFFTVFIVQVLFQGLRMLCF